MKSKELPFEVTRRLLATSEDVLLLSGPLPATPLGSVWRWARGLIEPLFLVFHGATRMFAESQKTSPLAEKAGAKSTCWYTVRCMVDKDPELALGDFVRSTGALKVDSYIGRDGKPASALVLIAFDVYKVEKDLSPKVDDKHGEPAAPKAEAKATAKGREPLITKVEPRQLELVSVQAPERKPEPVQEMVQEEFESDWTRLCA